MTVAGAFRLRGDWTNERRLKPAPTACDDFEPQVKIKDNTLCAMRLAFFYRFAIEGKKKEIWGKNIRMAMSAMSRITKGILAL